MTDAPADPPYPLLPRGKVRSLYDLGDGSLAMVASDRISAYDIVLDTIVPGSAPPAGPAAWAGSRSRRG